MSTDKQHLQWIYDRLNHVHKEEENLDYMLRLKKIIDGIDEIKYGPNAGLQYPSETHVQNFSYNGFGVLTKVGFTRWTILNFLKWTDDPGIGLFTCSDGKERLIPSSQLSRKYLSQLPERPKLDPLNGVGTLFGTPSSSK